MTAPPATAPMQLLMYRFEPGGEFEGRLLGALERTESGGVLRIAEALFVGKDAATGELSCIDLRSGGLGSMVVPLVGFRLDPSERTRSTRRALASELGGLIRGLAEQLGAGEGIGAVLVEHTWARALDAAAASASGHPIANDFIEATSLADAGPFLIERARAQTP